MKSELKCFWHWSLMSLHFTQVWTHIAFLHTKSTGSLLQVMSDVSFLPLKKMHVIFINICLCVTSQLFVDPFSFHNTERAYSTTYHTFILFTQIIQQAHKILTASTPPAASVRVQRWSQTLLSLIWTLNGFQHWAPQTFALWPEG